MAGCGVHTQRRLSVSGVAPPGATEALGPASDRSWSIRRPSHLSEPAALIVTDGTFEVCDGSQSMVPLREHVAGPSVTIQRRRLRGDEDGRRIDSFASDAGPSALWRQAVRPRDRTSRL